MFDATKDASSQTEKQELAKTYWGAIFSLTVLTFLLVGLEFMPVSLLTLISRDFAITEGQAGLSIVISAIMAIFASLFGGRVFAHFDRKRLILFYSAVLMFSSLICGLASHFYIFLLGRICIGLAIGGFWSLSTAIVARLAKVQDFPRAITILQFGPASALVLAAPVGSYLANIIGWRMTFLVTIPCGLLLFISQYFLIPKIPARKILVLSDMFKLLNKGYFSLGMISVALCFIGMNSIYVYLRPFLETITYIDKEHITFALLIVGLGGFSGLFIISSVIKVSMRFALIGIQSMLGLLGILLVAFGHNYLAMLLMLYFWGVLTSPFMVAWNTWMTIVIPDDLEAGGGLLVALIQVAIAGGAFLGGVAHDYISWWSGFFLGSLLLFASTLVGYMAIKTSPKKIGAKKTNTTKTHDIIQAFWLFFILFVISLFGSMYLIVFILW